MTRPPDADPATRRRVILTLIVLAQTVANIGPLGIPAIASLIRSDLGLTLTQAGSFLSAYYLGPVAMSLFAGMLADRWGTAKTLVLGQALIAAGLAGASAARSYAVFVTLMVVAGVGYGTLNPASTTAAMSWFPQRRRATVVGLKQVGLPFGGMLGAAILPVLALRLGWRRAVVVGALLIVVCAVACALIYHDPPGHALARRAPGERGPVLAVLLTKSPRPAACWDASRSACSPTGRSGADAARRSRSLAAARRSARSRSRSRGRGPPRSGWCRSRSSSASSGSAGTASSIR
ncbi:MAG: hypothetical protein DME12_06340 [Candidatus Rokuibacteriota bacterium]|nr:MAG: hypothetical protein DME12_06340 [Candidatus Rokubacteria bacterium]